MLWGEDDSALLLLPDYEITANFKAYSGNQRCPYAWISIASGRMNSGQVIGETHFCSANSQWLHIPRYPY